MRWTADARRSLANYGAARWLQQYCCICVGLLTPVAVSHFTEQHVGFNMQHCVDSPIHPLVGLVAVLSGTYNVTSVDPLTYTIDVWPTKVKVTDWCDAQKNCRVTVAGRTVGRYTYDDVPSPPEISVIRVQWLGLEWFDMFFPNTFAAKAVAGTLLVGNCSQMGAKFTEAMPLKIKK